MTQEKDGDITAYLETQGDEVSKQMMLDGKPVPGESLPWRHASSQSLLDGNVITSTPIVLPSNTNMSQSNSSGRSSRGTTPPLSSAKSPRTSMSRPVTTEKTRSSNSKSPKLGESASENLEGTVRDDEVCFDVGPPSECSNIENEKEDEALRPSPAVTPYLHMKRSISHNSKLSGAGYFPSASSFNSINSLEKTRSKRKSWINNALNPTYTSRCEDLRKNFPGLAAEEMLLGDYSCALQKDILVHGRIYVTNNFLCFYANIFKWETAVSIRWKDVSAMTKEKTALVIPNAIQICTGNEKLFFCSFTTRDKTHMVLFRVWQNALMDSPATTNELWSWVLSNYGEKSSRISDMDNDASNDGASNHSYDGIEPQMRPRLPSNIQEENEENKLPVNAGSFLPDSVGDKPMRPLCNKSVDSLPTDLSDNTESEPGGRNQRSNSTAHRSVFDHTPNIRPGIVSTDILTYEVWRQSKDAREILAENFKFNIDDLFTLLFTNSKFFYDFQAERKTFDIVQCPWQQAKNSDEKFRSVEFTLNLNHAMGPKTSRATEVQTMRSTSLPGHIYSVDVETTNADIPYGDTFYVMSHYCIVKVTEEESRLTVLCDIKYKKSPWGLVKSFIEKNVWAGIEDHYSSLSKALAREVVQRNKEILKDQGVVKKKTRRQRNRKTSHSETGPGNTNNASKRLPSSGQAYSNFAKLSNLDARLNYVLMFCLCLLCLLNIGLVVKIWGLEQQISSKVTIIEHFNLRQSTEEPRTAADWLKILQRQEVLHNKDLASWKNAVEIATGLLQQTENTMSAFNKRFEADTNRKLLMHFLQEKELKSTSEEFAEKLEL